ncbi:MAG: hypothetical protein Q9175_001342 [Cornicularia normoerica]
MAASTQPTTSTIPAYKNAFLQSCLSANVLTFGAYKLRSGRLSPYFFNAGSFYLKTRYQLRIRFSSPHFPSDGVVAHVSETVLVVDAVITAGTAMKETGILLAEEGRKVPGFVVALDRRERMLGPNEDDDPGGEPRMSAMGQIKPEYGVETASIVHWTIRLRC